MGGGYLGERKHKGLSSKTRERHESDESKWKCGAETTFNFFLCSRAFDPARQNLKQHYAKIGGFFATWLPYSFRMQFIYTTVVNIDRCTHAFDIIT